MHHSFLQRRPLLFAVLLLVVVLLIYLIAGTITAIFKLPTLAIYIIGNCALALIAIVLLSRLHWWRESGFRLPSSPGVLWLFVVPCLSIILNAFSGIGYPGMALLLLFFALALLVGFVEEAYFRGMILRALIPRGPWFAVIISSILFSIGHLLNLAAGANLGATLLQITYALSIGVMYAALRLRTQTLLPLVLIHSLIDFFGFLVQNSPVETTNLSTLVFVLTGGACIIYTVYSIILMQQVRLQTRGKDTGMEIHR